METKASAAMNECRPYSALESPGSKAVMKLKSSNDSSDKEEWKKGFDISKLGEWRLADREIRSRQQGVVKYVMNQLGSQLLSGKLANVSLSLPISIFEPRTMLDRVAQGWSYAPTLLRRASIAECPMERMKCIIGFVIGGLHFCIGPLKPFNPILGETFQATQPDGTTIFMEHISHHPPVCAFYVRGNGYTLSGHYEFVSSFNRSPNSLVNFQSGSSTITLDNGDVITYTLPKLRMNGILFGDRTMEWTDECQFHDVKNKIEATVKFNSPSSLKPSIFTRSTPSGQTLLSGSIINPANKELDEKVCSIEGSWCDQLLFDKKVYWDIATEPVHLPKPVHKSLALPSDSQFRTDLMALECGHVEEAQEQKLRLEKLQRQDRKSRTQIASSKSNNRPMPPFAKVLH